MAAKKRGLGRGLDALLGPSRTPSKPVAAPVADDADSALRTLGVEQLRRGKYQPRVDMHNDSLEDLADSIRAQGVVQPIVVRPIGAGNYEIVAGERRWLAAKQAGLESVPCRLLELDDQQVMELADHIGMSRPRTHPVGEVLTELVRQTLDCHGRVETL